MRLLVFVERFEAGVHVLAGEVDVDELVELLLDDLTLERIVQVDEVSAAAAVLFGHSSECTRLGDQPLRCNDVRSK